ncbi:hypothetical protein FSP39_007804, partial [Pinctada imbricata]
SFAVLSLKLLRRFFVGGVCLSEARLDGKTVIITGANTGIGKETARDLAGRVVILYLTRKIADGGSCHSKVRLDGKTVIITGANTGVGKETARDMAGRGARVIIACRDVKKGNSAADDVKASTKNNDVIVKKLDLASLKSVREFAKDVLKSESKINILINNAGIMMCPYMKTEDGFEMQFGTNHLGHFLLTNLLLDRIKESAPARIVNVSSMAHMYSSIDFENLNAEKGYNPYTAYQKSKLSNVLFSRELSRRLEGTGVTTYSLHPGAVQTELQRHFSSWIHFILHPAVRLMFKSPMQGAQTSIYCAVSEDLNNVSGKYFSDCAIKGESKQAKDDGTAKKLWEVSEKLVGLK